MTAFYDSLSNFNRISNTNSEIKTLNPNMKISKQGSFAALMDRVAPFSGTIRARSVVDDRCPSEPDLLNSSYFRGKCNHPAATSLSIYLA